MNAKLIGASLGALGALLWFMPLAYLNADQTFYQTGEHVGGIAYLLLLSSLAYSALAWTQQYIPSIIAASLAFAICLLFLAQAGASVAWGLIALIIVNMLSISAAVHANNASTGPAR
jgi:hypothetical protein